MKTTKTILLGSLIALGFSSCIKHEIIPAPEPRVDLQCHFNGLIGGSPSELTQNVNGYFMETKKSIFVPPVGLASATYFSEMKSTENLVAIKISMGNMRWDGNGTDGPPTTVFSQFFNNNLVPTYTPGAISTVNGTGGVEVSYRDGLGNIWLSKDVDNATNTISFSNVIQQTDKTGEYSKYIANFNCKVYHTFMTINQNVAPIPNDTTYDEQSFLISNAVLKGYFKR